MQKCNHRDLLQCGMVTQKSCQVSITTGNLTCLRGRLRVNEFISGNLSVCVNMFTHWAGYPDVHSCVHPFNLIMCLSRIYLSVNSGFCLLFDLSLCQSNFIPHKALTSIDCPSVFRSVLMWCCHPSVHPSISIPPSILPSLTRGVDGGVHYYRASQNRVSFYYKSLWSPWLPKLQARLLTHKKGCAAENQPPQ